MLRSRSNSEVLLRSWVKVGFLGLALSLISIDASVAEPQPLKIVTYEFVPLQMNVGGQAKGYVIDLAKRMVELVSADIPIKTEPIKFVPWRRAMNLLEKSPNVMFFSLSRTPAREDKFIWVGEVSPYDLLLYKLRKRSDIAAQSVPQIKEQNFKVGVQVGSNVENYLSGLGFVGGQDYITYSNYKRGIAMLFNGRFTMLPLTSFVAHANVCLEGYAGKDIAPVIRLKALSNPLWMVFSRGTSPEFVTKFRNALKALKKDGTAERLRIRYLADHQNRTCAGR